MDEARPGDVARPPDSPRPKRTPPTIDLEASEISESAGSEGRDERAWGRFAGAFRLIFLGRSRAAIYPLLAAAATGALAAALVLAVVWISGWLGESAQPIAQAQTNASAIETLSSRLTEFEGRLSRPATDVMLVARLDALEKSLATLRVELSNARARTEKLAAELETVKSAPGSVAAGSSSSDLAAIEERLVQLERLTRADNEGAAPLTNRPADDVALRRVVVASMLDLSVRQGEPFAATLAAAKALAPDPDALKPLEAFAASGVPNPASLTRELLTLVPQLSAPVAEKSTTGSGLVDRLQAGAAKLVRIERSDVTGHDRDAVVARITAAAVRNDLADARRELEQLLPADRAAANGWLDKVKARDTALAASHHFVADAMTALAKPAP